MGKQLSTKLNIYHRKFAFRIKQLTFLPWARFQRLVFGNKNKANDGGTIREILALPTNEENNYKNGRPITVVPWFPLSKFSNKLLQLLYVIHFQPHFFFVALSLYACSNHYDMHVRASTNFILGEGVFSLVPHNSTNLISSGCNLAT